MSISPNRCRTVDLTEVSPCTSTEMFRTLECISQFHTMIHALLLIKAFQLFLISLNYNVRQQVHNTGVGCASLIKCECNTQRLLVILKIHTINHRIIENLHFFVLLSVKCCRKQDISLLSELFVVLWKLHKAAEIANKALYTYGAVQSALRKSYYV